MSSTETLHLGDAAKLSKRLQRKNLIVPLIALGIALSTVIVALNVTTLVRINKSETVSNQRRSLAKAVRPDLVSSVRIEEVMAHLNEFQRISNNANGTRAINTTGFNQSIDFIVNTLTANTNYRIQKSFFVAKSLRLTRQPVLISSIGGTRTNHTFSTDASVAEFYYIQYTRSIMLTEFTQISVIPNLGCSDSDWRAAPLSPMNRVVLVKRGECTFVEKAAFAVKYRAMAILIYNDGATNDRMAPIFVTLEENNTLPALFLSYNLGQKLVDAVRRDRNNARVQINIQTQYDNPATTINICADTPTGDPTQTIVIGSHSDSVPEGAGINDNGSGSAANLGLAVALARLFRTSAYPKYKYRIRFCWWGAEEVGLLGSADHVKKAKLATTVGDRLQDYLINLNYDMLGSPNYQFGIYDGRTARNDTPVSALPGSNKITALFRDWFISQNLPWDYTDFSGRSDYGPFLAEGIVAGGLFSGADDVKKTEQRDRYDTALGQGMGGIPDIIHDPCYHKGCDSIQNINVFGYEKMVQAAAYVLEYLARQEDLKAWLYPMYEIHQLGARPRKNLGRIIDPLNEYLDVPKLVD